ncbi:hypothetical protein ALC56_05590 [Trachymyrmex septentrionalis]|uniref:Uncharacterized protein n=1 Tax=Trachymyrmex septentrionalis TaxID=34720 RepID=A0A151JY35_9HYME|nr:hypothetical protein ALC56_05590 [Trachymyrmex septentrionalis]
MQWALCNQANKILMRSGTHSYRVMRNTCISDILKTIRPVELQHRFVVSGVLPLQVDFYICSPYGIPEKKKRDIQMNSDTNIIANMNGSLGLTALSSILIRASNSAPPILQRFSSFSARADDSTAELGCCGIGGFRDASNIAFFDSSLIRLRLSTPAGISFSCVSQATTVL